jgi:hypothetical protein
MGVFVTPAGAAEARTRVRAGDDAWSPAAGSPVGAPALGSLAAGSPAAGSPAVGSLALGLVKGFGR